MNPHAPVDFNHVQVAVRNLHQAKATIIAGTDSNENIDFAKVPHGASLHTELELMVEAGLSPLEALQSATSLPARVFGLDDRGVIETGRRADLLLVAGDPTVDIKKTRAIQGVWIAGVEVAE